MAATSALTTLLLLVALAVSTKGSAAAGSSWCVCRPELPAAALQRTLDYACGHGADCAPLLPGGQCHSGTDTVAARCSYAANSYYHKAKAKANGGGATCHFGGTATLTSTDPSYGSCQYPASATGNGVGTTSSSTTPDGLSGTATTLLLLLLFACVSMVAVLGCFEEPRRHHAP